MNHSYKHLALTLLLAISTGGSVLAQKAAEGLAFLDREQPKQAQQVFNRLIAAEPTKADGYFYKGIAYLKTNLADSAGIFFQKAVAAEAKSALAHTGLGYWHQQQGQQAAATAAFEKAQQLSKGKDENVLRWQAETLLAQENPPLEAVHSLLDKALKITPQPDLYLLKGDAFLAKGEGGPAISQYEKAIALKAGNAKAMTKIARVYLRTKNYPLAMQYLQQAINTDAAYAPAYKEAGEVYYQQRQAKEAAASYERYVQLTELKHAARMRAGYMQYLAKDYPSAVEHFTEVLQQEPTNVLVLKYQAYSLLEAEKLAAAEATFQQYFAQVAAADRDVTDLEKYARLLVKQTKVDEAIAQYKLVLQQDAQHAEAHQALGELYFKQKNYTLAAHVYEQLTALRKQPVAQDYFALGRAHYFASSYPEADSAFSILVQLQPELLASSLWKARTLAHLDPDSEKGLSKPYYEKVIEKGAADETKYKNELKEAYSYLGYYYYVKAELASSKEYWTKVKTLDPQDAKATSALKALNP